MFAAGFFDLISYCVSNCAIRIEEINNVNNTLENKKKEFVNLFIEKTKKLKISTDNYVIPIDIGMLDNRILGLYLTEFKINDNIINLNLIDKNLSIDYIEPKKYNKEKIISVSHSGDLGDIIYFLKPQSYDWGFFCSIESVL